MAVFADECIQTELAFLAADVIESTVEFHLPEIGKYVNLIFTGALVYAVLLGGSAGSLAAYVENRNSGQQAHPTGNTQQRR